LVGVKSLDSFKVYTTETFLAHLNKNVSELVDYHCSRMKLSNPNKWLPLKFTVDKTDKRVILVMNNAEFLGPNYIYSLFISFKAAQILGLTLDDIRIISQTPMPSTTVAPSTVSSNVSGAPTTISTNANDVVMSTVSPNVTGTSATTKPPEVVATESEVTIQSFRRRISQFHINTPASRYADIILESFDYLPAIVEIKGVNVIDRKNDILARFKSENLQGFVHEEIEYIRGLKAANSVDEVIRGANDALKKLHAKIKEPGSAPAFTMSNKLVNYSQSGNYEMYMHPKIFRFLGIRTNKPWVTGAGLTGKYSAGIDKFLQTMWIYTSIIEPQYVVEDKVHLLKVVPVLSVDNSLISVTYDSPDYCKLATNRLNAVDIVITSSMGEEGRYIDFEDNEVLLTLHFRSIL
jgi:hypothetical protein